jgi:8-oxo-dGTP pyrophosphatase MutT (NUDIX family)
MLRKRLRTVICLQLFFRYAARRRRVKNGYLKTNMSMYAEVSKSSDAATERPAVRQPPDKLPRGRMVGASLLCYSVDPTWSRVYFLLGKERRNPRWKLGSERWSDFGGRVCSKAETAEDTAAKEFVEETLAVVKYFDSDTVPRTQWADIADSLRSGEYTFRLTFCCNAEEPRNYVTFVKQIPWDPGALQRFDLCREMVVNPSLHINSARWAKYMHNNPAIVHTGTGGSVQVKRDFMEKKMLGLWSIPHLQHAIDSNGVLTHKDGKVERCRTSFTGTVELVLSELAFAQPETAQEPCYASL